MVRRSSRVSRKSRSKVNRKMKSSRKVSRIVNKSRRVSRRVNKSTRMNKSLRVTNKRTKRVNKSRGVSRKKTKRVNNKRTKRVNKSKRVSRKRTREIEGGVKGFKNLKSALRGSKDTPPSQPVSPVSESELSEEEQHAKKTALLKRINSGDKNAITEYYKISQSFNHYNQNEIQQAINEMFERETMEFTQRKETETETGTGTERLEASELLTKTDDFLKFITIKLPKEHDTTKKKLEKLLSDAKESVGNQEDTKNYEQARELLFRRVIQPLIDFIKSIATKFDATLDESKYAGKSYSDLLTFAEELITDESGKKREELERGLKEVMGLKKGAEETLETKYPEMEGAQRKIDEIKGKLKSARSKRNKEKLQEELETNEQIVESFKSKKKVVEELESEKGIIKKKQTSLKLKVQQLNRDLESKKNNELLPLFNEIDTLVTDYERLEAKAAEAQAAAKEEFEEERRIIAEKKQKQQQKRNGKKTERKEEKKEKKQKQKQQQKQKD